MRLYTRLHRFCRRINVHAARLAGLYSAGLHLTNTVSGAAASTATMTRRCIGAGRCPKHPSWTCTADPKPPALVPGGSLPCLHFGRDGPFMQCGHGPLRPTPIGSSSSADPAGMADSGRVCRAAGDAAGPRVAVSRGRGGLADAGDHSGDHAAGRRPLPRGRGGRPVPPALAGRSRPPSLKTRCTWTCCVVKLSPACKRNWPSMRWCITSCGR